MAILALTNTAVYVGQADLTGYSNKVEIDAEVEALETTTFATAGYRSRQGGLRSTSADIEGFFSATDATQPDDRLFADLGNSVAATFCPTGQADGAVAYFFNALRADYKPGGAVGDMLSFTSHAEGNGPLIRGTMLQPASAKIASGTGTVQLLGAVSSTQRLYVAQHVFTISGTSTPTLTTVIQSDDNIGMSSPVTAVSLAAATAIGSQYTSVAGPITDTYFRTSFTISGTSPSFLFVVSVGIA